MCVRDCHLCPWAGTASAALPIPATTAASSSGRAPPTRGLCSCEAAIGRDCAPSTYLLAAPLVYRCSRAPARCEPLLAVVPTIGPCASIDARLCDTWLCPHAVVTWMRVLPAHNHHMSAIDLYRSTERMLGRGEVNSTRHASAFVRATCKANGERAVMGVLDRMPRHHEQCPQSKSNSGIGGVIFDLDVYDRLHYTDANSTGAQCLDFWSPPCSICT
ncbi:hypothetical protein MUK42_27096 [Musa troglodytarum]|uniref:Uncharacterized protein n=1 Tax=Musa troglodytarum TaxID=320322 RepID=A0A9E7K9I0_9LILI|nr:hypothetical protein MUK42_27096 [Musa troglodytarum]